MYVVKGKTYNEDPNQKLGGGSEGSVYPFEDDPQHLCVKLFHPPDPSDNDGYQLAQYRAKKVKAITNLGLTLPGQFVIPTILAEDQRKHVVGYLMRRVPRGYVKLMKLLEPAFRTSNSVGLRDIAFLYATLFEDLEVLGRKNIVVGDVNLGCNMVKCTGNGIERAWVDADSWSYPGYPCVATTELFCHPDLYPNLGSGGTFVPPTPVHDRFAYCVEFFLLALRGAHPFRMGLHPKASSLQERAEQGITIVDNGVQYPPFLPSPEVLSDELLDALVKRLKRKTDAPLPPALLRTFAEELVVCPKCSEQYHRSRAHCPKCSEKTMVDMTILVELLVEELYRAADAILFVQVLGDTLHLACRVAGCVHIVRCSQRGVVTVIPTTIPTAHGARYRFFGNCFVVCPDPYAEAPMRLEVYAIEGGTVRLLQNMTSNGLENDAVVFDASERFLYRTAGNTLMCGKLLYNGKVYSEDPVAQVHESQTWFTVDRTAGRTHEVIVGYDRALRDMQWFTIIGDAAGEKFNYTTAAVPALRSREKLEDFSVTFHASSVLLIRLTNYRGRQYVHYSIIGLDGSVLGSYMLQSGDDGYSAWEHIHGKLFQAKSILHVTPSGVVKQTLASGTYVDLKDTCGVVTAEDRLFTFGKKIGVARRNAILTIVPKRK